MYVKPRRPDERATRKRLESSLYVMEWTKELAWVVSCVGCWSAHCYVGFSKPARSMVEEHQQIGHSGASNKLCVMFVRVLSRVDKSFDKVLGGMHT